MLLHLPTVKTALRDAMATALGGLGVQCYAYAPNDPHPPAFFPAEVKITPQTTMRGAAQVDLTCRAIASASEDLDGQLLLDKMLSMSGDHSIWTAVEAARGAPGALALDGACDDVYLSTIDAYRIITGPNETSWYGANLTFRILGSSS